MKWLLIVAVLASCSKKHDSEQGSSASSGSAPAVTLKPVEASEAQTLEQLKYRTQTLVREWLQAEPTSDGWIATYTTPHVEDVEDNDGRIEAKETRLDYGVYVRRTIDGKPYKCVAKLPDRAQLAAAVAACKAATPSSP